jgi:dipeptidyl aminopeptidase/acylaminoacyl peptidase
MKKVIVLILFSLTFFLLGWFSRTYILQTKPEINFNNTVKNKPLEKYSIENLSSANINIGLFKIANSIKESDNFNSYEFEFSFNPSLIGNINKTTTGQINIPKRSNKYPLVIMLRGYIDQKLYKTGDGTRNASTFFAENGFITIAPDFLGYANSDKEADDIFEARFQTYTTVLSLIKSLDKTSFQKLVENKWDGRNIFIWGHSNGGQIALTILEITQLDIPTTLWAPVSKPFPYSILYYTDESEDGGKLIRRELAKFEDIYDTDKYSITEYFDRIKSPIQIHQGTSDDAVPVSWSNSLYQTLLNLNLEVNYYRYPDTNHNMKPNWNKAIEKDVEFFRSKMLNN